MKTVTLTSFADQIQAHMLQDILKKAESLSLHAVQVTHTSLQTQQQLSELWKSMLMLSLKQQWLMVFTTKTLKNIRMLLNMTHLHLQRF